MFKRIFGNRGDDQQKPEDVEPVQETRMAEREPVAQAEITPVEPETRTPVAQASAEPVTTAQVEQPRIQPLFRGADEIERTYHRAPQSEPERRLSLRRLFGGEEHTVEEIAREEQKTEQAVQKTRAGVFGRISEMFTVDEPITDDLWEELEELLIRADVGVDTTLDLIGRVRRRVEREDIRQTGRARAILKQDMVKLLQPETRAYIRQGGRPYTILVVGVNGAGKTTLIAKVANRYHNEWGQNVLLAAADTFRAAAVEQLQTWGERIGVPVHAEGQGADPASVAFVAVERAQARNVDTLIIDTAGRLQAKHNLMAELKKITMVVNRKIETAPHEVLLVVDATTGQNGVTQAKEFMKAADITHLALTKLDGTAKGGIAFAMVQEIKRPIRYIGTGEKVDDLALFDPEAFVDALFEENPA
jgi:fused signal recognition particle receptor